MEYYLLAEGDPGHFSTLASTIAISGMMYRPTANVARTD
jgi:hypothetical protein